MLVFNMSDAQWVSSLNKGLVAASTEVVVSPPSVFLGSVKASLRKDFGVAAQVSLV